MFGPSVANSAVIYNMFGVMLVCVCVLLCILIARMYTHHESFAVTETRPINVAVNYIIRAF